MHDSSFRNDFCHRVDFRNLLVEVWGFIPAFRHDSAALLPNDQEPLGRENQIRETKSSSDSKNHRDSELFHTRLRMPLRSRATVSERKARLLARTVTCTRGSELGRRVSCW